MPDSTDRASASSASTATRTSTSTSLVFAPRVVCVLGMHRSGTSVVASLLHALGVHLGDPADLLDPLPENPRGFWEHRAIKHLNDALLARLGGCWHTPPIVADGWERAAALDDLRAQARALLHERFGASELWGWKDPRTCTTLPFWKLALPEMSEAHYVICVRNPIDVARSLRARDDLPLVHGLRLWLTCTAAALVHSAGSPRLILFYDDVLDEPMAAAEALARCVGRPPLPRDAVAALVAPELRHHRTSPLATTVDRGCPYAVSSLYVLLRSMVPRANGQEPSIDALLNAAAASASNALASTALASTTSASATMPSTTLASTTMGSTVMRSSEVSVLRSRGRDFLAKHRALAIAYRRVRRIVRRWLRLGP